MRAWMAAVALAALLAGCSGPASDDGPPSDGVTVITDPRDLLNGTAPGSHIHDYWGGRSQVDLLRIQGTGGSSTCNGCADGMTFASVRPDEEAIVPQGTRWVNGTWTLESDGQDLYDSIELWVKTAQDVEPTRIGPVQSGLPFSIETTQQMNDPPHYVLSLWVFELRALGGEEIHVGGRSNWAVDAIRGLPLVPYPPHPDRWNGAQQLDLLEEAGGTDLVYTYELPDGGSSTSCFSSCLGVHRLPDGVVVPYDAARVEVRLTIDSGPPAGLGMWFHGANTWEWTKATAAYSPPATYVFDLPLEPGQADSPYAPQSLWEFDVWLDQPQPAVGAWAGEYTLSVTAYR